MQESSEEEPDDYYQSLDNLVYSLKRDQEVESLRPYQRLVFNIGLDRVLADYVLNQPGCSVPDDYVVFNNQEADTRTVGDIKLRANCFRTRLIQCNLCSFRAESLVFMDNHRCEPVQSRISENSTSQEQHVSCIASSSANEIDLLDHEYQLMSRSRRREAPSDVNQNELLIDEKKSSTTQQRLDDDCTIIFTKSPPEGARNKTKTKIKELISLQQNSGIASSGISENQQQQHRPPDHSVLIINPNTPQQIFLASSTNTTTNTSQTTSGQSVMPILAQLLTPVSTLHVSQSNILYPTCCGPIVPLNLLPARVERLKSKTTTTVNKNKVGQIRVEEKPTIKKRPTIQQSINKIKCLLDNKPYQEPIDSPPSTSSSSSTVGQSSSSSSTVGQNKINQILCSSSSSTVGQNKINQILCSSSSSTVGQNKINQMLCLKNTFNKESHHDIQDRIAVLKSNVKIRNILSNDIDHSMPTTTTTTGGDSTSTSSDNTSLKRTSTTNEVKYESYKRLKVVLNENSKPRIPNPASFNKALIDKLAILYNNSKKKE